jgi:hypothetical protein
MSSASLLPATYHLRNRTLILVISPPIVLFCLYQIIAYQRAGAPWLNWFFGLLLWCVLAYYALRRRLVLSEAGLEYRSDFSTLQVGWGQVVQLVSRRTLGVWQVDTLVVRSGSPVSKEYFIDLTQFDRDWRQGNLGTILRQYAPQLFPPAAEQDKTG